MMIKPLEVYQGAELKTLEDLKGFIGTLAEGLIYFCTKGGAMPFISIEDEQKKFGHHLTDLGSNVDFVLSALEPPLAPDEQDFSQKCAELKDSFYSAAGKISSVPPSEYASGREQFLDSAIKKISEITGLDYSESLRATRKEREN